MGKEIHLVDMRFNPYGHFMGDLKEFRYINKENKYKIHYTALGGEVPEGDFYISKSAITTNRWVALFLFLLLNRNKNILFLSCSYIPLLIMSIITMNFNYHFRFTSMPYVKVTVYKKIIRFLSRYSKGVVVCDYPVKDYLVEHLQINRDNIKVLIGRTIPAYRFNQNNKQKERFKVTFIGALNAEKDLSPFLESLKVKNYDNIDFTIASKGFYEFYPEYSDAFELNNVKIRDEFLDDSEYSSIIEGSDFLMIPYTPDYGVRASAILFDAMKEGKIALTNDFPQFIYYQKKYNNCITFRNSLDLASIFDEIEKYNLDVDETIFIDYNKDRHYSQLNRIFT